MIEAVFGFCFVLGLVVLSNTQRQDAANRIREAFRLCDIGVRRAAALMRMDVSSLEQALKGMRRLDAWRLEMLPPAYHQHHALLELRDRGLPEYARVAIKISPAVEEKKDTKEEDVGLHGSTGRSNA